MSPETLATLAGGLAVVALLVVLLLRSGRQERLVREELGRATMALLESQRGSTAQLADTVDRFHRALVELGQSVQGGQVSTGAALRTELEEARRTLQQQLEGLVGAVNAQLARSQQSLGERFEGATRVFGELKGQLGQVAEMASRMETLGREIEELQGILKAPKLRGQLGEATLEEFLRQVLPEDFFSLQHRFSDGSTVDAVIRLRGHLVPVDAKFPLEAFRRLLLTEGEAERRTAGREFERSLKGRIDEISEKYIRPGEGTFEFALMFIPAESVYYEMIVREGASREGSSILDYAVGRRVVPVSPNSFYAYLMTIATGLKGMQVEARTREILAELGMVQREFDRLVEAFRVMGRHLAAARSKYDDAERLAGRLGDRLRGAVTGASIPPLDTGEPAALAREDPERDG